MIDFTTPAERKRKAKADALVAGFTQLKQETGYANWRIMRAMAESGEFGYKSLNSIHKILINANVL